MFLYAGQVEGRNKLFGGGGLFLGAYAVSAGSLPSGIILDETTGTLSGAPLAAGTYTAVISVTPESTGNSAPQAMGPMAMMGGSSKTEPIAYYELVITVR